MKGRRLFFVLMATIPWIASCATFDDVRLEVPFSVPYPDPQKAGAKISADFDSPGHPSFWRYLIAPLTPRPIDPKQPPSWGMYLSFGFRPGDSEDAARVEKLSGGISGRAGAPILLRIKIISLDDLGKTIAYDKEAWVGKVLSGGNGWDNRIIDYIKLVPGAYHLEVENVKDVPELENTPINFSISYTSGK